MKSPCNQCRFISLSSTYGFSFSITIYICVVPFSSCYLPFLFLIKFHHGEIQIRLFSVPETTWSSLTNAHIIFILFQYLNSQRILLGIKKKTCVLLVSDVCSVTDRRKSCTICKLCKSHCCFCGKKDGKCQICRHLKCIIYTVWEHFVSE